MRIRRIGTLIIVVACGAGALASVASAQSEDRSPTTSEFSYFEAELVTEPEEFDAETLAHILDLRETYGLSVDPAFVDRIHADPMSVGARRSPDGLLSSLWFTEEEAAHAQLRAAAKWVGGKVDAFAVAQLDGYTATVVEPDASITLLCAKCDPVKVKVDAQKALDVVEPYELSVRTVEFSATELVQQANKLSESLQELDVPHGVNADLASNQVVLHVADSDASRIPVELSANVVVEGGFKLVEPDTDKDDLLPFNLVEGGQYISGPTNALSSGFAVQNGFGTFILTAGHYSFPNLCAGVNGIWVQGGVNLGFMSASCEYGGDSDGALISTFGHRTNWGRVHWRSTDNHQVTFGVTTQNLINQTVCQTGWNTTGPSGDLNTISRCGVVSSTTSTSPCTGNSPAWTAALGAANYRRAGGDSGAGVIWPTGYGFGAAGTHSCQGFNGGTQGAIFSRFSVMANQWGLSITP